MNKEFKKIIILHEYGEPSHYLALKYYAEINGLGLEYRSFNIAKVILLGIRKKRSAIILSAIADFFWMLKSIIYPAGARDILFVVGMAPFDKYVFLVRLITRYARLIYHTSWLYWDGGNVPKKGDCFPKLTKTSWCKFFEKCDAIATVTPDAEQNLVNNFYEVTGKTGTVFHSYDENIFYPCVNSETKNKLSVVFLGRLEKYKGIEDLISLARLNPELIFKVIGAGPEASKINNAAKQLKNIQFLGYIDDKKVIANILRGCVAILLPSKKIPGWEELFGISLIEAMACGCIPITSKHKGPATILTNTIFERFLIDEAQFVSYADSILKTLLLSPTQVEKLRQESSNIAEKYSARQISKKWLALINL
ncbi:glycosyltransferase family 4 protein [Enterobacteriaceae bacterium YMB-R22]|uniref:glycosyltransferase family 4 protein n=1 Tax=Tenebrionicola larvae TaxID=2815733 RepID=UPI0020113003|nr:glycosyltransferase family 4 protein [Tenebrionicola larvae]MBV4412034.1 glycosyltransferase family 4 protein [Tenebrionicola larvae]